jgi:DNA repair protein RadC
MDEEAQQDARGRARAEGIDALSDAELLAVIMGTGRKGDRTGVLSAELLAENGGVGGLAKAGLGQLAALAGVGPLKAARLAAAFEIGRRAHSPRAPERVRCSHDVHRWAQARVAALEHEELWMLALDGNNGLRAARRVAMGGLHGAQVSTRDALRCALREGASAFVLVHNHPSGDPTPSPQDLDFTERVVNAADLVGTPLVDHVVVAGAEHRSLAELGLMPLPWRGAPHDARTTGPANGESQESRDSGEVPSEPPRGGPLPGS